MQSLQFLNVHLGQFEYAADTLSVSPIASSKMTSNCTTSGHNNGTSMARQLQLYRYDSH